MNKLFKYAQHFTKLELMKARLEVFQNESGREGVDFIITSKNKNTHNLYLQIINLDKERSIKILKQDLGELKDNLWIALVLIIDKTAQILYLIPSKILASPNNPIFIDNESRFEYLSNWEIKVFTNAIAELSKFSLDNMVKEL